MFPEVHKDAFQYYVVLEVYVRPFKAEHFAFTHAGIEGGKHNSFHVRIAKDLTVFRGVSSAALVMSQMALTGMLYWRDRISSDEDIYLNTVLTSSNISAPAKLSISPLSFHHKYVKRG